MVVVHVGHCHTDRCGLCIDGSGSGRSLSEYRMQNLSCL